VGLSSDGCAFFAFRDAADSGTVVRAQKIDLATGNIYTTGWAPNGNLVGTSITQSLNPGNAQEPLVITDLVGGAYISYRSPWGGNDNDVLSVRMDSTGVPYGCIVACSGDIERTAFGSNWEGNHQMTSDGIGGAINCWEDRNGPTRVQARRFGINPLIAGGSISEVSSGNKNNPDVTAMCGYGYFAWEDRRVAAVGTDIYAAGEFDIGPPPTLVSSLGPTCSTCCIDFIIVDTICEASSLILTVPLPAGLFNTFDFMDGLTVLQTGPNNTYDASVLAPGTYNFQVIASTNRGCITANSNTLQITINPLSDASFTYTSGTYCISAADPTPAVTGTPGGVFTASNAVVIDTVDGTIDLDASGVGTYMVYYTTAGACPDIDSLAITITTSTNAEISYAGPYCATGMAPVTFGIGASAGVFSTTGGLSLDTLTGEIDLGSSTAGTYVVTNTIVAGGGCAVASDTANVVVNPLPNVTANTSQPGFFPSICEGDSAQLTGSGAASYSWDNGVTDGDYVSPITATVYTVTGTDTNNCSNTDQVTLTVNTLPTVDAGPDQTVCDGETVTLTGSGATIYYWNNGVTDGVPFTPSLGTTTYSVTVVLGLCANSDSVEVTVNPLPTVDAGPDQTVCDGDTVILIGSGASTYTWDNGVTDGVSFIPSTGTTTYTVTGTDTNNCSNTDQVHSRCRAG